MALLAVIQGHIFTVLFFPKLFGRIESQGRCFTTKGMEEVMLVDHVEYYHSRSRWYFQRLFCFTEKSSGFHDPIGLVAYFSDGLVQPPTREALKNLDDRGETLNRNSNSNNKDKDNDPHQHHHQPQQQQQQQQQQEEATNHKKPQVRSQKS